MQTIFHREVEDYARATRSAVSFAAVFWMSRNAIALCATLLFLTHFEVIYDLLLNRRTTSWNLFDIINTGFLRMCISTSQVTYTRALYFKDVWVLPLFEHGEISGKVWVFPLRELPYRYFEDVIGYHLYQCCSKCSVMPWSPAENLLRHFQRLKIKISFLLLLQSIRGNKDYFKCRRTKLCLIQLKFILWTSPITRTLKTPSSIILDHSFRLRKRSFDFSTFYSLFLHWYRFSVFDSLRLPFFIETSWIFQPVIHFFFICYSFSFFPSFPLFIKWLITLVCPGDLFLNAGTRRALAQVNVACFKGWNSSFVIRLRSCCDGMWSSCDTMISPWSGVIYGIALEDSPSCTGLTRHVGPTVK